MTAFIRATAIRAARTGAQTAIGSIGGTALIEGVSWGVVGSTTGLAMVLSILMSIATGLPEVDEPGKHAADER